LLAIQVLVPLAAAAAPPADTLVIGLHVTLATRWLDPGQTEALITPFMMLYAIHDALTKPMPGKLITPSLAESWTASKDGLSYDFMIRKGVKFHNGDPVTAEDVKFTFERYKGASAALLKSKVKEVQVLAPNHVRFILKEPWPDFMAFYGTSATGAAWIVPKKYIEKVGEEGFRRQPIGLGPYRVVRQTPGVELVMEANEQCWRKKPSIKTVVFKQVTDRATRLAMLKTGEADIAYVMIGIEAATIQRLVHERVMFGPIFESAILHGIGPRVDEAGVGLSSQLYLPAPYEEMSLKKR
jgi:peptide/nickel transport system substrate-binding protein